MKTYIRELIDRKRSEAMSEGTDIVTSQPQPMQSTMLVARNAMEMQQSQQAMSVWLAGKLATLKRDMDEYIAHYDHAKEHKWKTAGHAKAIASTRLQITFYEKIKAAIDEGYAILPDLPSVRWFAMRVDTDVARIPEEQSRWKQGTELEANRVGYTPDLGIGEYVSSIPKRQYSHTEGRDAAANKPGYPVYSNYDWDSVAFPLKAAHVQLMDSCSIAMKHKIFDEFGIFPRDRRPRDPMIVGRIVGPKASYCFVIAWYLDLKVL